MSYGSVSRLPADDAGRDGPPEFDSPASAP
jgi:hypothetical protein